MKIHFPSDLHPQTLSILNQITNCSNFVSSMAHSLHIPPPPSATTCTINTRPCTQQRVFTDQLSTRRKLSLKLVGALVLGSSIVGGDDRNAYAAARRPPPPPPQEKKDPNVSGVQAKVLASKKRKEAMKQEIAKLRERGKPVAEEQTQTPE